MKFLKIGLIVLIFGSLLSFIFNRFFTNSCSYKDIYVSPTLYEAAKSKGYNYCELLRCSLDNSEDNSVNCVLKISKIQNLNNAAGYEHGEVIVSLVIYFGEDNYINIIHDLNSYEKKNLLGYLLIGLQYDTSGNDLENLINYLKE